MAAAATPDTPIRLGFGLYRHQVTSEGLAFARQCGATHLVVHLVDYFGEAKKAAGGKTGDDQPCGGLDGWGPAGDPDALWSLEEMQQIKSRIEAAGLVWEAVENWDPAHWSDVLLAGPKREAQLENQKVMLRRLAEVGVKVMGYNFSIAGVAGRTVGSFARGGAKSVGMTGLNDEVTTPMPQGMAWNMTVDRDAKAKGVPAPAATHDELWARLKVYLDALTPVAEEVGIKLALHPDDPPLPFVRGQPRLVYQRRLYDKVLELRSSTSNGLEFCLGTLAEMEDEGDMNFYDAVHHYTSGARKDAVAYIHFRNVTGSVPHYKETFIDDGKVDWFRVIAILHCNNFSGMIIPDHAPQMSCSAPWHSGMAFACGYMRSLLQWVARMQQSDPEGLRKWASGHQGLNGEALWKRSAPLGNEDAPPSKRQC